MGSEVHVVTERLRQVVVIGTTEPAAPPCMCRIRVRLEEWQLPDRGNTGAHWFNSTSLFGTKVAEREFTLEVTSDLKVRGTLTAMERELLAPLVEKLVETLVEEPKKEVADGAER